jgi:hypothetical protein
VTALLLTFGILATAQERQVGGVGLTVFVDSNYRGEVLTFRTDMPNLATVNLSRLISSLQVGPGEQWEVCDEPNYGGACLVVSGSETDLRRRGWNDRIASARRVRPVGGGRGGRGGGTGQAGLELYSNVRFYGERQVFTSEVVNLYQIGFNDRAMSLAVPANEVWEVCVHENFRDCRSFSSSVMDLSEFGLAKSISSVRPIRRGRGGGVGSGGIGSPVPRIILFDNRDFSGPGRTIERDTPVVFGFGNRAESLRVVGGGTWEICDGTKYSGRCITVGADVADLGRLGFANQIQSVRLRPTPR